MFCQVQDLSSAIDADMHCAHGVHPKHVRADVHVSFVALVADASADGATGLGSAADTMGGYGPSKAGVALHAMLVAPQQPSLVAVCCTPGFIDMKLTAREAACRNAYRSCYKQCGGRSRTKDTNIHSRLRASK